MPEPTVRCPICDELVSPRVPVIFDLAMIVHLHCYTAAEGIATLVYDFLETRPSERFCDTCLSQNLLQNRQAVEKAVTALRLTRKVVVEPTICATCDHARVTAQIRQDARPASP
jgi:hypothetical protein